MDKTEKLIQEARRRLIENPRDAIYDLSHHEAVWENCEYIIKKENLRIDVNALKISTFWHDVILKDAYGTSKNNVIEVVDYLLVSLKTNGFSSNFIETVRDAVDNHEFLSIPHSIECMVLQDADKLDVLSKDRWLRGYKAYQDKKISHEKLESYIRTGFKWLPLLIASFYFDATIKQAEDKIKKLVSDKEYEAVIKEFGLYDLYLETRKVIESEKKSKEVSTIKRKTQRIKLNLIKNE